jgi:hypothetical protein
MSQDIFDEANQHFMEEGQRHEYGRGDKNLRNRSPNGRSDSSRTEQDLDGDGLRGVDCSSLVWRGLKNAGYDVGDAPFSTSKLFNGSKVSDYSKQQFDVIDAKKASQPSGELQPGDVLMFKSGHGQHVGIFKGYDKNGNIEFLGSQVSTGPAVVSKGTQKGGYWNGGDFEIAGALRAKPEFRTRPPLHAGTANAAPPLSTPEQVHVQASPKAGQLSDPTHPGHEMFKQAQAGMQAIDAKFGRTSDHQTDNAAGHVAVKAKCAGMKCIDHLELGGTSGDRIIAVQGKLGSGLSKVVSVDTVEALNMPLAQSSQASAEVHAQQQGQQAQQVIPPVRTQEAPAMSR